MKRRILDFNSDNRIGLVSGDDGKRCQLEIGNWKGSALPTAGSVVDFTANGEVAQDVYPDTAAASSASSKKVAAALSAFFLP